MFHSCVYCTKKSKNVIRCEQCNRRCHLVCLLNTKNIKCDNCHLPYDSLNIISNYVKYTNARQKPVIKYTDVVSYIQDLA